MDFFFALLFVFGLAFTVHHVDGAGAEPDSIEAPTVEQPAPCPPKMREPRIRDLTVAFEKRVYLLPSGETCRPRSPAPTRVDTSARSDAHDVGTTLPPGLRDAYSDN